ncbi:DUF6162 family protein [Desulfobacter sp.]|uniref:DUF6162 family protein n=1 Tax=Desulfobacter sp. TaxID=2294 RepID=UPI003D0CC0EA
MNKQQEFEMQQYIVKPVSTRAEVIWLLVTVALVVAVSGSVIAARTRPGDHNVLSAHQISAFEDLDTLEQGTFNDLYAAAMDIESIHDEQDDAWPSPKDLSAQGIPPFTRDRVWETRGRMAWEQKTLNSGTRHMAVYFGRPGSEQAPGCFLLIMQHSHGTPQVGKTGPEHGPWEIWHHDRAGIGFPGTVTDPGLIAKGWKEVVPYKGEEEVKRLKGEIPS